jgi:putative effector of murein hydrolase LrgA (UPF0299 family)
VCALSRLWARSLIATASRFFSSAALVSITLLAQGTLFFVPAMVAGIALAHVLRTRQTSSAAAADR